MRGPGSRRCWGGGRGGESGREERQLRLLAPGGGWGWRGASAYGGAGRGVWLAAALGAGVAARAGRCLSVKVLGGIVLTFLMPRAGRVTVGVCCLWVEEDNVCCSHAGQGVAMPALGALPRVSESQRLPCPSPSPLARVCARCTCVCVQAFTPLLQSWSTGGAVAVPRGVLLGP